MAATETCSRCGQEVRWGVRADTNGGLPTYLHREKADHLPIFGQIMTPEMWAQVELERHKIRHAPAPDAPGRFMPRIGSVETTTYTTAEFEANKIKNAAKREAALAELRDDDEEEGHDVEPIEVYSTPMPLKGNLLVETPEGPREVPVPGGVRNILNAADRAGWEALRLSYSRGPFLGSTGKSLGVCDCVVLHVRGRRLDGRYVYGLASWRNGKSLWAYTSQGNTLERVGAKALIAFIKENPCG